MAEYIRQGEKLQLLTLSTAAISIRAVATMRTLAGRYLDLVIATKVLIAGPSQEYFESSAAAPSDGWIEQLSVYVPNPAATPSAAVQRGQLLVRVAIGNNTQGPVIAQGYVYDMGAVVLGQHEDPGPRGGSGYQRIRILQASGAPATTALPLAVHNTFLRYKSFGLWYICDANAASRSITFSIRNQGTSGLPTGFTASQVLWGASTLTLTATQDGAVFADAKRSVKDTNGTVAVDNAASAPTPLPLDVTPEDLVDLRWGVTNNQAGDLLNVMALTEEWLGF